MSVWFGFASNFAIQGRKARVSERVNIECPVSIPCESLKLVQCVTAVGTNDVDTVGD